MGSPAATNAESVLRGSLWYSCALCLTSLPPPARAPHTPMICRRMTASQWAMYDAARDSGTKGRASPTTAAVKERCLLGVKTRTLPVCIAAPRSSSGRHSAGCITEQEPLCSAVVLPTAAPAPDFLGQISVRRARLPALQRRLCQQVALLRTLPTGTPVDVRLTPQHSPAACLCGASEARARLTPASASRSLLLRSLLLVSRAGRLGPDCACVSRQGPALSDGQNEVCGHVSLSRAWGAALPLPGSVPLCGGWGLSWAAG